LAQKISVIANTKAEANTKAFNMLGEHPRFGEYGWAIIWDRIDEEPSSTEEA